MQPLGSEAERESLGMCSYTEHRGLESHLISGRHRCPPPCRKLSPHGQQGSKPGVVHSSCMVMGFLCPILLLILSSLLCQYVFVRLLSSGGVRLKVEDEENRGRDSVLARNRVCLCEAIHTCSPAIAHSSRQAPLRSLNTGGLRMKKN